MRGREAADYCVNPALASLRRSTTYIHASVRFLTGFRLV